MPEAIPLRKILRKNLGKGFNKTHLKNADDTIVLQYTGGTTGVAKSAELTNENLVANMLQAGSAMVQQDKDGNPVLGHDQSIMVAPLPLYHIYSFAVNLMTLFRMG